MFPLVFFFYLAVNKLITDNMYNMFSLIAEYGIKLSLV